MDGNLGHISSVVRRTTMVRSIKDFLLVSTAVWSHGPPKPPQTSITLIFVKNCKEI